MLIDKQEPKVAGALLQLVPTVCLLQGVLVELPLAGFFLKKMRNPHSDVNDLVTLDPELYRNLMFMRDYDGDFADLALTFTVADSDAGHNREVGFTQCCLTVAALAGTRR